MNLDNSDFIKRHGRTPPKPLGALPPPRKASRPGSWWVILVFIVIAAGAGEIAYLGQDKPLVTIIALALVAFSGVAGFFVFHKLRTKANKVQDYDLLQEVLDGSRGARLITDSADNTVYHNKRFEKLCRGVGLVNLATLKRLFEQDPQSLTHFDTLSAKAHRGAHDQLDLFSNYEGNERWLTIAAQPVAGYPGYIHWRVDDVTAQYTVDRAIKEEREKLIDFTDNAPVGFFSVDEDGKFVFANATFARWVGEDLRTLLTIGRLHTYLLEPPTDCKPYDLTEESTPRQMVEVKMKGPLGKSFLASINQIIVMEGEGRVRTRAVVRDLTAEREMRQALEASEDRFQRFFEDAPLGIILLDEKGRITDCNSAFADMLGASVRKLQQGAFEALLSGKDYENVMLHIGRISDDEQGAALEVTLNHQREKTPVAAQMYARKFKGSHSTVLHFIDVTERKSLEAQFVQSQKMQAIGQLAGGVAHDFNNLLTAIIGYCDLLMLRHKPGDPSFQDIRQVEQNAQRAAALVKKLLAFSRQQTLQTKMHDVSEILVEVSHLLRRLIGVRIDLDLIHGDDLAMIRVDERQMEQVFMNLAVNARDAMEGEGRLIIATGNHTSTEVEELISEDLPPGNWVKIDVTDTGHGIDPDNLSRIFEPFFTTKDVGEGTGLGLATVYGIIRQSGGFLDVNSVVGKGTTFTLYMPQATEDKEDTAAPAKEEAPMTEDLTGSERILLVEDEDSVRTFSERALTNKGYEVISAASGDAAWEMFEKGEVGRLDLMITDVMMPGMDGPALVEKVREVHPDLKVLFMSGYTEDKLKDGGADNIVFLPKPFTLKQLAAKVKEMMD